MLEKRQFIVITDRYLIVGKYPRTPNIHLYSLIPGTHIQWPGIIRYGPEDMAKTMEALEKHKIRAIPLEQISAIDITMPKKGLWKTKKGYFTIHLTNGSVITVVGKYGCPFDDAVKLFNQLFPGKVRVFNQ